MTEDDDFYQKYMDDFMSKHPKIKVVRRLYQQVDTGAIQVMMASNDAADIINVSSGPGRVLPLAKAGMIVELTPYYTSRGWETKTIPYALNTLRHFDDKIWEVVDELDVFQIYYNKAIFAKTGLTPPKTWNEFIAVMDKLKAEGIQPLSIGATDNLMLGWFTSNIFQASAGSQIMTDIIYGNRSWNIPEIVRAYQTMADFMDKGYINKDAAAINNTEARTRHAVGQAAMALLGNGFLSLYIGQGLCKIEDFGTFVMPSIDGGLASPIAGLGNSWIINKNTKKMDACLEFLDYVYDEKIDFLIQNKSERVPCSFIPLGKTLSSMEAQTAADALAVGGTGYNISVFATAAVKTAYFESNQAAITKQKTPQQIAEIIQAAKLADIANK
jgi:raffinose/stachyose/melibiose transport system substrate-binding protein